MTIKGESEGIFWRDGTVQHSHCGGGSMNLYVKTHRTVHSPKSQF
jgi:hypothetical protein